MLRRIVSCLVLAALLLQGAMPAGAYRVQQAQCDSEMRAAGDCCCPDQMPLGGDCAGHCAMTMAALPSMLVHMPDSLPGERSLLIARGTPQTAHLPLTPPPISAL